MNKAYPIQHWLTSLVLAIVLIFIASFIMSGSPETGSLLSGLPVVFFFSLLFSLPAFAIYYAGYYLITKATKNVLLIRSVLNTLAIICVFLTSEAIFKTYDNFIMLTYSAAIIISSFIFKLTGKQQENADIAVD